jgi:hypothetical protein
MGLKDKKLGEDDYKKYILEHYISWRPVFVIDNKIYIGTITKKHVTMKSARLMSKEIGPL